jgi:hypothetical protein
VPSLVSWAIAPARQRSGDIRVWPKAERIAFSDRGRIPATMVEQHEAGSR